MKTPATVLLLAAVIFASACVPSLYPLYTEQEVTFDSALIGVWTDAESGETWALSKRDKLDYRLVHTDTDGLRGEFIGRLVKVEDNLFFDIVPIKPGFTQSDFYRTQYFSTHTFVHFAIDGSTAKLSYLEPKWLEDYLAEHPDAIRHERLGGDIMLTSSPKETQKFLLAQLNTRGAFSRPGELTLKRGAQ